MRRLIASVAVALFVLAVLPAGAQEPLAPCTTPSGTTAFPHTGAKEKFIATLTPSPLGSTGNGTPVNDTLDPGATKTFRYQLDLSRAPLLSTGAPATMQDVTVHTSWTDPTPAAVSDYDLYVYDATGSLLGKDSSFNPQAGEMFESVALSRLKHCSELVIKFVSATGIPGVEVTFELQAGKLR